MFGKKRTREDVEQYISSIMFPGETVEALHIERFEPSIDFAVVTSQRLIVTAMAGGRRATHSLYAVWSHRVRLGH